jgi:hypothetical protein
VSDPEHRPISLVLDTSAVLAFVAGSMAVHEPILLADEAEEDVAVPVACLLEAVRRDPGADLRELLHHRQIVVATPVRADEDLLAGFTAYFDGREDCAAAAVVSHRFGRCGVLTGEPDAYMIAGERPHWIVSITETW